MEAEARSSQCDTRVEALMLRPVGEAGEQSVICLECRVEKTVQLLLDLPPSTIWTAAVYSFGQSQAKLTPTAPRSETIEWRGRVN